MLTNPTDPEQIRAETVKLACTLAREHGQERTPPIVWPRIVEAAVQGETTGLCRGKREIFLTVPSGASIPQCLALICHEVAHWLAPMREQHGSRWARWFGVCLAAYGVELPPGGLTGTKHDIHQQARQALATRLGERQATRPEGDEAPPEELVIAELGDDKRSAVLRKVAKLLALSERAGSEAEAATAAAMATRLLRVYQLSMSDLDANERDLEDPMTDELQWCGCTRRVHWRTSLGFDLARATGCYALSYKARWRPEVKRGETCMRFFGRASAVKVCGYLYAYCLREIERIGASAARTYKRRRNRNGVTDSDGHTTYDFRYQDTPRAWGSSFRFGAACGVADKLHSRAEAEAAARSANLASMTTERALAVIDHDRDAAQEWAYAISPPTGSTNMSGGHGLGAAPGRQAGMAINVNRPLAGGRTRRLLT